MQREQQIYKTESKVNHHIYTDIKTIFPIIKKILETLIQKIRIHNQKVRIEFRIENYVTLIMKSDKR